MGLTLLLPLGLLALAAWLVPLLIHLARRQESRLTEFAALRWLRARPRPRRRVRLDEWPLLLLRLLLLALLALLLAGLALRGHADDPPRVVVAPGVQAAAARTAVAAPRDARWLWLAPGFPAIDTAPPASTRDGASLLRELDAALPAGTPLTVVVPAVWDGADAQRPRLTRPVQWRVVAGPVPAVASRASPAPRLRVSGDATTQALALRHLRALQAAWHGPAATLPLQSPQDALPAPDGDTWMVWLWPAPLPPAWQDWLRRGGQVLIEPRTPLPAGAVVQPQWRDAAGQPVLEAAAVGRGRLWRLHAPLRPDALPQLLEPDFPRQLLAQWRSAPAPRRVDSSHFAPLRSSQPLAPAAPRPLAELLAVLIAVLFLLERAWSASPRRGRQA